MQLRTFVLPILITCLAFLAGCTTTKTSTTARTAVEMALMSESAKRAIDELDDGAVGPYQRFFIDENYFVATDQEYMLSALRRALLNKGLHSVESEEDADIIVQPRIAAAAIDENKGMLGVPSVPAALPGIGAIELPELALYKKFKQQAVNKMGVFAINADDRSLAFDWGEGSGEAYYTRYTVLFLITFRTTDLNEPYRKPKEEKAEEEDME